jgi:hypothetical protein
MRSIEGIITLTRSHISSMSQLKFLTPEQEALIPGYQEKWRQVYLSTQPIDRVKAEAAVKAAYVVMGKKAPTEIIFCASPRAALERLRSNIERVEIPTEYTEERSSQQSPNFFQAVFKTGWEIIKAQNKQRGAATKPLHDLLGEVSSYSSKILAEQIDKALSKDLTTKDIVEQSFFSSSSVFNKFGKELAERGDPDLSRTLQDKPQGEWQETFGMTASALESQLAYLPAKGFLFRGWLKSIIQNTLSAEVYGLEHPDFTQAILKSLDLDIRSQIFLRDNPSVVTLNFVLGSALTDFVHSVMNNSYTSQKWSVLQELVRECGWIFATEDICIICDRPTKILLDEDNRLHAEAKPALEFADRFVAYAHHNSPLPQKYGSVNSHEWQSEWIATERDAELQQLLIQKIGAVRLCQEFPMIEIDSIPAYTLLKIDATRTTEDPLLKYVNPDTGVIDAVFVSWTNKTVRSAIKSANKDFPDRFPLPSDS